MNLVKSLRVQATSYLNILKPQKYVLSASEGHLGLIDPYGLQ